MVKIGPPLQLLAVQGRHQFVNERLQDRIVPATKAPFTTAHAGKTRDVDRPCECSANVPERGERFVFVHDDPAVRAQLARFKMPDYARPADWKQKTKTNKIPGCAA